MKQSKDLVELLCQVEDLPGWRVENRPKGWIVFPPDRSVSPITVTHGPKYPDRAYKNARAKLRRAGAEV